MQRVNANIPDDYGMRYKRTMEEAFGVRSGPLLEQFDAKQHRRRRVQLVWFYIVLLPVTVLLSLVLSA